jgi:hypothetical protein
MRLALLMALLCAQLHAATIYVANYGDGTAAKVNFDSAYAASVAGDTIVFPLNGSATWAASATIGRALTINGNGTTLTAGATLADGFFYITGFTSTSLMRVTAFTFDLVNLTSDRHALKILNSISLTQLRVDHNTFQHGAIQVEVGGSFGVFDHNAFNNGASAVYYTAGSRAQADASWASMAAGTANALFFEDNIFTYNASWLGPNEHNSCFDTFNGGKLVLRYNTVAATAVPASWTSTLHFIILHGNAAVGAPGGYWEAAPTANRGQSVVEIYNNTINAKRADYLAELRGSANLVHDNTLDTTAFDPTVLLYEEEQYEAQFSPQRTAWPAEDQVHNSFFWNNTLRKNGVTNTNYINVPVESVDYVQEGRDYFLHAPQSSGGSESFSGANGASGSYPTDGVEHPTLGTMTFSATGPNAYYGYAPYTYPHPLQVSGQTNTVIVNGTLNVGTLNLQ